MHCVHVDDVRMTSVVSKHAVKLDTIISELLTNRECQCTVGFGDILAIWNNFRKVTDENRIGHYVVFHLPLWQTVFASVPLYMWPSTEQRILDKDYFTTTAAVNFTRFHRPHIINNNNVNYVNVEISWVF